MSEFQNAQNAPAVNGGAGFQPVGGTPENLDLPLYGATFGQAFQRFFKRYARFDGRSSRSEYWWVAATLGLLMSALYAVAGATAKYKTVTVVNGSSFKTTSTLEELSPLGNAAMIVALVLVLAALVPSIANAVRRLHDGGFSGWLYLLCLLPFLGGIALFVLLLMPPKPEGQRFDRPGAAAGQATSTEHAL
jgi:uncharacterized membrane protein YhaH (DUF805 family)